MPLQLTKQEVIEEMTRRPVAFYSPVRIYFFGSSKRTQISWTSLKHFAAARRLELRT
jgi:hypothetical protein